MGMQSRIMHHELGRRDVVWESCSVIYLDYTGCFKGRQV